MADKKLNQVSQLTDFDYALVVKGNDVAKVTKQQLATMLGELISKMSSFMTTKGHSNTFNIWEMGTYYIASSSSLEGEPNGAYRYGVLEVLDGSIFKAQIYIPHAYEFIYIRAYDNNGATPWRKFTGLVI